jgi:hypothetical protein
LRPPLAAAFAACFREDGKKERTKGTALFFGSALILVSKKEKKLQ